MSSMERPSNVVGEGRRRGPTLCLYRDAHRARCRSRGKIRRNLAVRVDVELRRRRTKRDRECTHETGTEYLHCPATGDWTSVRVQRGYGGLWRRRSRRENEVNESLDEFAERLLPVAHKEGNQKVK